MTKPDSEVIEKFNEYVNMTADDLEEWLKSDPSTSSGWNKEDGSGETVGHDSGRKIVEILKDNPDKDPSKYTSDHLSHMHKVVAYCARHLAQEAHMKDEKSPEELRETKSYKSLKNWGHDSLKKDGQASGGASSGGKKEQEDGEDEEKAAPSKGKGKGKASKEEIQEDEKREEASKADADQGSDGEGGIISGKRKRKERDIQVQEDPEYNSEEDDDFAPGDDDEEEEGEGDDSDDDDEDDDEEEDDDDDEPAKKKAKND